MAKRRAPRKPPRCTAILLCERAIFNKETEKNSVVEVQDTIPVWQVPTSVGPLMAYARFDGGIGGYTVRFEIQDREAQHVVAETKKENWIEFGSTDEVVTLTTNFPPFEIAGEGLYDLIATVDDLITGRFTFRVVFYQDEEGDDGAQDEEESRP